MTLGPWYVGDTPTTDIEIHVQRDGEDIGLDGFDSAEILLYSPDRSAVVWDSTPVINTDSDVVLVTPPATSPFDSPGIYLMYLRLKTSGGASETFFATDVRVLALGAASGWATTSNVRSITGATITEVQLAEAQGIIELYAGRVFGNSIRSKDLTWLQKAVAYQAAWQISQPGYLTRHGIKEVNQDGAQIIYAGSSEPNNTALLMLGPLARRALKNVSWMGSTSIKVRPTLNEPKEDSYGDYKRNDAHPGWRPL